LVITQVRYQSKKLDMLIIENKKHSLKNSISAPKNWVIVEVVLGWIVSAMTIVIIYVILAQKFIIFIFDFEGKCVFNLQILTTCRMRGKFQASIQ